MHQPRSVTGALSVSLSLYHVSPLSCFLSTAPDGPSLRIMASPPRLPHDIISEILSYCDLSILVAACRTSLAFLELAGPRLYRHVRIRSLQHLQALFCDLVSDASLS